MSPRNRVLAALILGGGAALAVELAARFFARRDLLASFLNAIDPPLLALGAFALFTRLFVFFLVPGWIAYAAARWALEARQTRSPKRQ
jgi:hypothetical protein